jgi:arabinoxylan arabinofuranohydrolase
VNWTDDGIQVAGSTGVAPFTNNSCAPGFAKMVVNGEEKYFRYYANGCGSSNGSTPGAEDVARKFDPAPLVDDDGRAQLCLGGGRASTSMAAEAPFNNPKNLHAIARRRSRGVRRRRRSTWWGR